MRGRFVPMVGKTYGELTVLADVRPRKRPSGQPTRLVRVRCSCGKVYVTEASHVRSGRSQRCRACRDARNAAFQRDEHSTRLPSGRTIAQVALESGVSLNTVFIRYTRGWPEQDLGLPIHPHGQRRKS